MENKNLVVNEEVAATGTEEVVKMELFAENAEYLQVVKKAKSLGMRYAQIPKPELIKQVNERITQINEGEIEAPEIEEKVSPVEELENEIKEAAPAKTPKAPKEPRVPAKKWHEEENAFPYEVNDVVEIIGGKDLHGRKVVVKEPSAKKNAIKGHLVHPVNGSLQKSYLSIDFDRLQLIGKNYNDGKFDSVESKVEEEEVKTELIQEVEEQEAI